MMKLQYKLRDFCCALMLVFVGIFSAVTLSAQSRNAYADNGETGETVVSNDSHFVTIYDETTAPLTVKTTAPTVAEVLSRAEITLDEADAVEPSLDTVIDSDEFKINIHRAHPALVIDGLNRRYIMTAHSDPATVARDAGVTIYDGDVVEAIANENFLEAGAAQTFRIERSGGRMLTTEETIPYPTEEIRDVNLAKGERNVEQAGADGQKVSTYEILFENNREVSRTLISEEVTVEPTPEIVRVGAKPSIPPEREQCAAWAREAGVSEADLEAALYIIYHESGCRVDAANARSGAYGIPQALPGEKMATAGADWRTNPVTQLRWMIGYVNGRYGGWQGALNHKNTKGWY